MDLFYEIADSDENKIINLTFVLSRFDLDVADPTVTPGVSTPVPGGFLKGQVFKALETIKEKVTSIDVVEYIPKRDPDGKTGKFAADIISFFL